MVRHLARRILERQGYKVLEALGAGEAYLICKELEGKIDLLLTDVVMPNMNGNELFEMLATINSKLKVLYMSGYTENMIEHHGVLKQGVYFIQKPFTAESLLRKVRDTLESR